MMLEPERAASLVAERLRRPASPYGVAGTLGSSLSALSAAAAVPSGAPRSLARIGIASAKELCRGWLAEARRATPRLGIGAAQGGKEADRARQDADDGKDWLVRRTLEELGIHCESTPGLQDLKGFLIASPRGVEIVVSGQLDADERLAVYCHLLAHALLERPELSEGDQQFYSRLEYVEGRQPETPSGAERRTEMVADAIAQAMLRGRLEGAPQYSYRHRREPFEPFKEGLRPTLGRIVLEVCHRTSLALFWHSPKYQRLRGRPEMTALVRRLEDLVRVAYAC